MSPDETAAFLKVTAVMQHGLIFEFALPTGMRLEEYLALLVVCDEWRMPLSILNITYRYFRPLLTKAKLPRIRLYACATPAPRYY